MLYVRVSTHSVTGMECTRQSAAATSWCLSPSALAGEGEARERRVREPRQWPRGYRGLELGLPGDDDCAQRAERSSGRRTRAHLGERLLVTTY